MFDKSIYSAVIIISGAIFMTIVDGLCGSTYHSTFHEMLHKLSFVLYGVFLMWWIQRIMNVS